MDGENQQEALKFDGFRRGPDEICTVDLPVGVFVAGSGNRLRGREEPARGSKKTSPAAGMCSGTVMKGI